MVRSADPSACHQLICAQTHTKGMNAVIRSKLGKKESFPEMNFYTFRFDSICCCCPFHSSFVREFLRIRWSSKQLLHTHTWRAYWCAHDTFGSLARARFSLFHSANGFLHLWRIWCARIQSFIIRHTHAGVDVCVCVVRVLQYMHKAQQRAIIDECGERYRNAR